MAKHNPNDLSQMDFVVTDMTVTQDLSGIETTEIRATANTSDITFYPAVNQHINMDPYIWTDPSPRVSEVKRSELQTCVVCGLTDEGIFVLCSLCKEAVASARKRLVREMIEEVGQEEVEQKEEPMDTPKSYHCGYTTNGNLEHAVGFYGKGYPYAPRAACGVRITKTKPFLFGKWADHDACQRCEGSSVFAT